MASSPERLAGWRWAAALAGTTLLASLLAQTLPLQRLETALGDLQRALAAPRSDFSPVLVVDVDETSMQALQSQLGAWPYTRQVYALVHEYLARSGAAVIGYDILFTDPRDPEGDAAFARALAQAPRGVLAAVLTSAPLADEAGLDANLRAAGDPFPADALPEAPGVLLPLPILGGAARAGTITVTPDADGRLRRVPLGHRVRGHTLPSLAVAALGVAQGGMTPDLDIPAGRARLGKLQLPVNADGTVLLDLPRNLREIPVMPFYRVVLAALGAEGYAIPPELLRGRAVFIGSTMAVLGDYVYAPSHGRIPGLALQALTYLSLREGAVYRSGGWLAGLGLALLALWPALLFGRTARRRPGVATLLLLGGLAAAAAVQAAVLLGAREQTPAVPALLAAALALALTLALHAYRLARERERLALQALAAQEASALKGRFLAHMTHELRTPLTAIIGYNQLLAEDAIESERREHTAVIDRSAQHLLGLINNILDQAKLEAGQMKLDLQPTDPRRLVDETLELLRPLAARKGLELQAAIDAGVPARLQLDPLRVRQILINLIGNALKFTPQGGVTVAGRWAAGRLALEVRDTGPGIPRAALERIFNAFQQASVTIAAEFGGTGLGLSISKNLARLMDGGITVRSELGRGSTFTVAIAAAAAIVPAAEPAASPAASGALRGRVLLADDNPDNRALIAMHLKKLGLAVLTAGDGKAALESARREAPDAILMDLLMPGMDGLEATRALRQTGYAGPILALTAHTDASEQDAAREAGCDEVLVKPVSPEALRAALAARLR